MPPRVHGVSRGKGSGSSFVKRYGLTRLVCAERPELVAQAIQREKLIKSWPRAWKVRLIHSINPGDLHEELV